MKSSKLNWNSSKSNSTLNIHHPMKSKHKAKVSAWFADSDRDGVPNVFDCQPRNPRKQGWKARGHQFSRERSTYVKMMSPEKFLRTTLIENINKQRKDIGFNEPYNKKLINKIGPVTSSDVKEYSKKVVNQEDVTKLKHVIRQPRGKMEIPFLEYDVQGRPTGHEGRHRATAAKQMGVKLIPVTIARELKEPRDWANMRKEWGYHKTKKDWRNDIENTEQQLSARSADIPIREQRLYGIQRPEVLQSLKIEPIQEQEPTPTMEELGIEDITPEEYIPESEIATTPEQEEQWKEIKEEFNIEDVTPTEEQKEEENNIE